MTSSPFCVPRVTPAGRLAAAAFTAFVALTGLQPVCAVAQAAEQATPQLDLPRTTIRAGMFNITAQVAATPQQRSVGLMYRRGMPQHEGMLFVFEQSAVHCFWMKNTPSPLTAAFVADDGTIVTLADMEPFSEASHCPAKPVRYVLEMNQGWFATRNIKAGYKLGGEAFGSR